MSDEYLPTHPMVFENAPVGRILQVTDGDPTPEGWADCDGGTLRSREWPEFVKVTGVTHPTFDLPNSQRTQPGLRHIIKLGQRRDLPGPRRGSPFKSELNSVEIPPEAPPG